MTHTHIDSEFKAVMDKVYAIGFKNGQIEEGLALFGKYFRSLWD